MKVILLAAGKGTRISRMIEEVPKSTLPVAGKPLIRRTVEIFCERGIQCVVCTGYQKEKIEEALEGLPVTYYYNPFYNITNSLASLWFAQQEMDGEDVLIMNSDVYFEPEILDMVLQDKRENVVAIDKTRTAVGDYFFKTTDNGCISKYGKELPLKERSCEYVGIAKITKAFMPVFKDRLNLLVNSQKYNFWWENVLYSFTDKGERDIYTVDVNGLFWAEIDFFDDYERILKFVEKKEEGGNTL
ncbi:MAG: phosphocholine cytidylyltransferase family protein [Lachnospiraceae bacterium]|nr:phosphocholine cytidylyltransferase family protein [Lachnospiraceae bacterium]